MDTDVGDAAAGPDEVGAELERLRHADRLDRDVRAETAGQLHNTLDRVLRAVVDRDIRTELERASRAARRPGRSRRSAA
jgi:hypothetical protein